MMKSIAAVGFSLIALQAAAADYGKPEVLVPPSPFMGIHGLAVDAKGRLLAGTVVGNTLWEVDAKSGKAKVMIGAPMGQSDDIAIGPKGEMAWTSFMQGVLRARVSDEAPIKDLASGLPGINSLAYDQKNGRLYASQVFLGDALWEIDVEGAKPPRKIAEKLGGFNGFEVGKDGLLYGPLWFKGQVAKINPENGEVKVVAEGFGTPAAANFDSKGNLWVVDTKTGELVKVDPASGKKTTVAKLKPALDNLAIDKKDRIFVSNMADHSIQEVDAKTGKARTLVSGKVAVPGGIKLSPDGKTLYVADVFAFRLVDTGNGKVSEIRRMQSTDLEYPFAVGISDKHLLLASWFTGTVQVIDRANQKTKTILHKFTAPTDAVELPDGSILVSEIATGNLVQANGADWHTYTPVVKGLHGPVQMIVAKDGGVYVTEAAGRISRVDPKDWSSKVVAEGLALPEGIAQMPDGKLVVAEAAARRLTEIDPASGAKRVLAEGLPIGYEASPGTPPSYVPTGVAVDAKGVIYVSADRNNAIYRIKPR